jgi:hypothetical protein
MLKIGGGSQGAEVVLEQLLFCQGVEWCCEADLCWGLGEYSTLVRAWSEVRLSVATAISNLRAEWSFVVGELLAGNYIGDSKHVFEVVRVIHIIQYVHDRRSKKMPNRHRNVA